MIIYKVYNAWTYMDGLPPLMIHPKLRVIRVAPAERGPGLIRCKQSIFPSKKMSRKKNTTGSSVIFAEEFLNSPWSPPLPSQFALNEPQSHTSQRARWLSCSLARERSHWISINTAAHRQTKKSAKIVYTILASGAPAKGRLNTTDWHQLMD